MICPKCGEYVSEGKWCSRCGTRLELDDITINTGVAFSDDYYDNKDENSNSTRSYYGEKTEDKDYGNHGKKQGGIRIALAILCPVVVILIIFSALLASGVIDFDKSEDKEVVSDAEEIKAKTEYDAILKRAMNSLKIGDYEASEDELKKLMELDPYDDDVAVLCKIVFNYNRALDAFKDEDISSARDYFDKIPIEYLDYVMSADIKKLENQIEDWEYAYAAFAEIQSYMANEEYGDAEEAMLLLDESCLSESDAKKLNEYMEIIEKKNKEKKEDKKDYDEEDTKEGEKSSLSLGTEYAESLISSYCAAYVAAVNSGDFSLLSQYITGDLYDSQKKMVESCVKDGTTMNLDYVKLKSLKEVSSKKWTASVSEGETMYYADGSSKSKAFSWVYTIEYINGRYYLTKIE